MEAPLRRTLQWLRRRLEGYWRHLQRFRPGIHYTNVGPRGRQHVSLGRCRAPTPASSNLILILAAGALVFKDAPNYEMPADAGRNNVYNVTVVATDNGVDSDNKNKMTATRAVTIMVTNVEEDGTVTLSAQQPYVGVPLTASVTDLDGGCDRCYLEVGDSHGPMLMLTATTVMLRRYARRECHRHWGPHRPPTPRPADDADPTAAPLPSRPLPEGDSEVHGPTGQRTMSVRTSAAEVAGEDGQRADVLRETESVRRFIG